MSDRIEELLEMPYWLIDVLPEQVPEDSAGQYFAIEEYYLTEPRLSLIKQKHIDTVLKLNCYRDLYLDEENEINPDPAYIAETMRNRHVCIMLGDSMIVSEPDELYMTLYDPNDELLRLVREIASKEGLHVWQHEQR